MDFIKVISYIEPFRVGILKSESYRVVTRKSGLIVLRFIGLDL